MTKYFIGTGNFADDARWSSTSGGSNDTTKPTAADDVRLDANSGNCTINTGSVCRSIDCTGYTGVLTHTATVTLAIGDATAGAGNIALKFVAGMTYTLGNTDTSYIQFVSTSNTEQTIDFGGKTTSRVTFNGVGGNWKYIANHSTISFRYGVGIYLSAGTLNLNGQTFSLSHFQTDGAGVKVLTFGAASLQVYSSSGFNFGGSNLTVNSSTEVLTYGAGGGANVICGAYRMNKIRFTSLNATLVSGNFAEVEVVGNSSTLSITAGTIDLLRWTGSANVTNNGATIGAILIGTASANARTLNGSRSYDSLTYTVAGSTGKLTLTGANSITTLSFSDVTNARTLELPASLTTTIGTITMNGTSGKLMSLTSNAAGTPASLSIAAPQQCNYLSVKDITASSQPLYAGRNSTNVSGNTNVLFVDYFTKEVTDTLSITDALTLSTSRDLTDNISITDVLDSKTLSKVLADETLSITDSLTYVSQFFRELTDNLAISDSLTKSISKVLIENPRTYLVNEDDNYIVNEDNKQIIFAPANLVLEDSLGERRFFRTLIDTLMIRDFLRKATAGVRIVMRIKKGRLFIHTKK